MRNPDHEAVLRDLLMEMGVRGAEHLTPFAIECLADFMREKDNATPVEGGWPRRRVGYVGDFRERRDWALTRFKIALVEQFDIDSLHSYALAWPTEVEPRGVRHPLEMHDPVTGATR